MPPSSHPSSLASDLASDSPDSPRSSDASPPPDDSSWDARLRGLRWRVMLQVLPPCPAPIEVLRRAAANGRRRYAELRRRLLVDPHTMEDVQKPDHLSMDNPLSQDPESLWGRYFRNAEVERTIENDLARLYPEHGSFFQSSVCQAMLRRILLVWALIHPHYSYRQGMHELLAPLLYVLHMDVTHLSQVRQRYEDPFEDRFDAPPLEENFAHVREGKQKAASFSSHTALLASKESTITGDEDWVERVHPQDSGLVEPDEFGFNLKTMVLGSDSYGAEGELGALLSGRFVEHDAYCMFDAVLRGQGGAVALADYFMTANEAGSATGLPPVLEASAAMYRALAAADMSLYIHLVGFGVEPQFFALRWLRVLFGREFDLEKLLLLWDAIFAAPNTAVPPEGSEDSSDGYKCSPRGAFISALAVSMLLYLRPTLLAAPNATSCLQKLLNFPKTADVRSLIENAKMLQSLAEEAVRILPSPVVNFARNFEQIRGGKLNRSGSGSPPFQSHINAPNKHRHPGSSEMIRHSLPESYWEEKWKNSILQKVVPEEAHGVPNMDTAGSTGQLVEKKSAYLVSRKDSPSVHALGNTPGYNKIKQSMLSRETEHSNGAGGVHHIDGFNKSARRKLLGGLAEGTTSPLSPEDRKGDPSASRSVSLPASPRSSEASGFSGKQLTVAGRGVSENGSIIRTTSLDESDSAATVGSASGDVNPGSASAHDAAVPQDKAHATVTGLVHQSLHSDLRGMVTEGDFSDDSRSAHEEASFCEVEDDIALRACCASAQGAALVIHLEDQSSTHPVVSEDSGESSGSSSPLQNSEPLPSGSPNGKFSWIKNFGRSDPGDETSGTVHVPKNGIPTNGSVKLADSPAGNLIKPTDRDLVNGSNTPKISKEKGPSAALRTLGHSMVENIQVLETALSQRSGLGKEGSPPASREKSEHFSKTFLGGKGQVAALSALAELRKISNILLQM